MGTPSPSSANLISSISDLCFAHAAHLAPVEITGESVNALATRLLDHFLASLPTDTVAEDLLLRPAPRDF